VHRSSAGARLRGVDQRHGGVAVARADPRLEAILEAAVDEQVLLLGDGGEHGDVIDDEVHQVVVPRGRDPPGLDQDREVLGDLLLREGERAGELRPRVLLGRDGEAVVEGPSAMPRGEVEGLRGHRGDIGVPLQPQGDLVLDARVELARQVQERSRLGVGATGDAERLVAGACVVGERERATALVEPAGGAAALKAAVVDQLETGGLSRRHQSGAHHCADRETRECGSLGRM